jgi:folate-binding protein YgfZ
MSDPYHGDAAARKSVAWIDRSDRARLAVAGPDRARFLHNLATNDVKRLAEGDGREAFVTSPQGKTLGYVTLLACPDHILLRTDPGGLEHVLPHLRKYGVFDDVALDDLSDGTFELHLAGPHAEALVGRCARRAPRAELAHVTAEVAGRPVRLVRESPAGVAGLTLIGDRADRAAVIDALERAGAAFGLAALAPQAFEALRIAAGTPVFGRDLTPDNLPQELDRDARAISFVKGCYLGQETVARLDALGHVNRILRGVRCADLPVPTPGTALEADGKTVGTITSAAYSLALGAPVALAIVRTTHAQPGTALHAAGQAATVNGLPMTG